MDGISDDEWVIAEHIIHNIDNNGYLQIDIDELIQTSGQDRESVLEILAKTQRLDPVGCGARDLQECLLIQAQVLDQRSPLLEKVIREHMKDLERKDYDTIAKSIGVKVDRIKEVEHIIQSFHPRPGRLIATEETHYVVPDIFVVEQGGEFVVQVNDDGVPRLRISKLYQDLMKHTKGDAPNEAKDFVQDKLRAALWLIKSIQNRQNTIFKVSKAIVRRQQDFFRRGSEYLKPMILKDIADEIGMHESTVSRVTTNKFMHTPIGLFELKYFFNSGIGGKNGGIDISNEVLKIKLKRLIESEDVRRPFSDQKLAELLSESDVVVARRTVAKYREMLGVASSASRKKKSK
jgi:RNA polymerase sigma-54 factor